MHWKNYFIYLLALGIITTIQSNVTRVLIVGRGGREHALAWKVAQSPQITHVYVAPGNGGTAQEKKVHNCAICETDVQSLVQFAQEKNIDLAIIGPETALACGIIDAFQKHGIRCVGPTQKAAQLETSKKFAKLFMQRHNIPTASWKSFNNATEARKYIQTQKFPLVIKADGLAAGKGVTIAYTQQEAEYAIDDMLIKQIFGNAGTTILIEEFLEGTEVSFIVLSDGDSATFFATAQDYKKRDDGNQGPNTGGMGAYSPVSFVTPDLQNTIMKQIIQPTIDGMRQEGNPYVGFLYAGLMITREGPKVIEFNARLGDPETQPILMRLESDFVALCTAMLDKSIAQLPIKWDNRPALGVVLVSGGYPSYYQTGYPISGLQEVPQKIANLCKIFHAGTQRHVNNNVLTDGGRVLCVTALGSTIQTAREKAYEQIKKVSWQDMQYRTDIGLHPE